MKAKLKETNCPKLHIKSTEKGESITSTMNFLFVSNSFCHNLALWQYFWLLSNTDLNQRPVVSWSSTTKSWVLKDRGGKKVHLRKHNRCEFHQSKVLICWGSILLSLEYKTSENETSKKKSLSFKEGENAEKRLNGY